MKAAIAPLLSLLVACGGSQATAPSSGSEESTSSQLDTLSDSDGRVRFLGRDAAFNDLLRAARTLDDRRDQESDAGCLLGMVGDAFVLRADLAVAVRPLRRSPDELGSVLADDAGPITILSRWGNYGDRGLAFTAVTTTLPPVRSPAILWVIASDGVYVRSSAEATRFGRAYEDDALASSVAGEVGALFVTAEGDTPLRRVREVLARVPSSLVGRVGFAAMLEPGTRLPPVAGEAASSDADLCPSGLPELAADEPLGDLSPAALTENLGPLRDRASFCVGSSPAAAGGRVRLALRIGADGAVRDACVVEDPGGDAALRECLRDAARSVMFPAPRPAGVVDVVLPIVLAAVESQRQRPLCE